ncbi:hypothetical protein GPECTOR_64g82 [Gonium pectorale]|uniref:Uncharacterized protein n=1 Tax=Gonium pectorale TaxID=33097 RepID=A0A150G4F8_GONPE|nr:hypothetical protein GPECTOR_64g82 [Gonium pectorale]|eukprot:KXZ44663.1 hypothetical protein GPECTOR_64g82 [Gonium pectorale]
MVTKEDLKAMVEKMATKEDLKAMVDEKAKKADWFSVALGGAIMFATMFELMFAFN